MINWILYWAGLISLLTGAVWWFARWCSKPLRGVAGYRRAMEDFNESRGIREGSLVDWTWVRIMEYEIYGRIFQHDGAPGISGTAAGEP